MAATMVNEQPAAYLKLLYLKLSVQQPHSPADSYCKASLTSERSECSTSADEGSCGHEENSELDDDVDNCLEYQHGDEPTFTEKRLAERSLTEDYEDEFDDNEEEVIDQQGVQSDDDTVESAEHLCTQVDGLFMREVCDDSTPILVGEKIIGRQKVEDDSEQKEQEEAEDIQTRLRECFQRACENCSLDDGLETISVASEDFDDIYIESQEQIEQGVDNDLSAAIDRNSEAGEHMSVADTHLKVKEPVMRMCDEPPPEAPAEDGNDSDYAPLEAPAEDGNDSDYAPEELEEMLADDGVWAPPEVASEEENLPQAFAPVASTLAHTISDLSTESDRLKLKDILVRASTDGSLVAAIEQAFAPVASTLAHTISDLSTETDRLKLKDILVRASTDGSLVAAIEQATQFEQGQVHATPMRDEILPEQLVGDAMLASSLEKKAVVLESVDDFRSKVKQCLLQSTDDGSLAVILQDLTHNAPDKDINKAVCVQGPPSVDNATLAANAGHKVAEQHECESVKDFRLRVADSFVKADRNGMLATAIQQAKGALQDDDGID